MSDWIEWNGGECPVAEDQKVDARFRRGDEVARLEARFWTWEWVSGHLSAGDIIAYRLSSQPENT